MATSIAGSAVMSRDVRNRASRVALPPTNSAETAAADKRGDQHGAGCSGHGVLCLSLARPLYRLASLCTLTRQKDGFPAIWGRGRPVTHA